MFSGNRKYYWVLGTVFLLIVLAQYTRPKPVNWLRTYMQKDKIPFGCYAIFNLLEKNYAEKVFVNKLTLYEFDKDAPTGKSLIMVNDNISLSRLEFKSLWHFVARGNTALLAANEFNKELKDTFKLKLNYDWLGSSNNIDTLIKIPAFKIRYLRSENNLKENYAYSAAAVKCYFTSFDTSKFKVVSVNEDDKPVLLKRNVGTGTIYLSSLPDIFTNFFIVDQENRFYVYTLLSMLRNKEIIWDEHYKTYNVQNESIFRFIFGNDALYSAWLLLLLSLIFFIVFSIKRKQRPIPVITPYSNSTLEFVDVISNVYFNSKNHKHVIFEKINYFYFDIRSRFNLNTSQPDDDFYRSLSRLTGIPKEEITDLFGYIENLKRSNDLNEHDLIELNKRINNFKQKSIR